MAAARRTSVGRIAGWVGRTLCLFLAGAVGAEWLSGVVRRADGGEGKPVALAALEEAYAPFAAQALHPYSLFSFAASPALAADLSNDVCTLDAAAFRGPGPEHARGRRRAFLLGGSTAFGYLASSDATTITGYLNLLQDDYLFVNAGVPGWNSTQALFRTLDQILDYQPDLVVTLDGATDARIAIAQAHTGRFTPATPEGFSDLAARVNDDRPALFPHLREAIRDSALRWQGARVDAAIVEAGAARYVRNLRRIHDATRAAGGRVISVFEPVATLHQHAHQDRHTDVEATDAFHRAVFKQSAAVGLHDFGRAFDSAPASTPTAFLDGSHLTDRGNEMLAKALLALLGTIR